jgi:chromosome segregation ATPase
LPSDDLFSTTKDPKIQWEGLEKRINGLLEGIVKLRNANGQLMKENLQLQNQLKETAGNNNGDSEELQKLRKQYDEAIHDLKQVKNNLQRMETLANEIKLEGEPS